MNSAIPVMPGVPVTPETDVTTPLPLHGGVSSLAVTAVSDSSGGGKFSGTGRKAPDDRLSSGLQVLARAVGRAAGQHRMTAFENYQAPAVETTASPAGASGSGAAAVSSPAGLPGEAGASGPPSGAVASGAVASGTSASPVTSLPAVSTSSAASVPAGAGAVDGLVVATENLLSAREPAQGSGQGSGQEQDPATGIPDLLPSPAVMAGLPDMLARFDRNNDGRIDQFERRDAVQAEDGQSSYAGLAQVSDPVHRAAQMAAEAAREAVARPVARQPVAQVVDDRWLPKDLVPDAPAGEEETTESGQDSESSGTRVITGAELRAFSLIPPRLYALGDAPVPRSAAASYQHSISLLTGPAS